MLSKRRRALNWSSAEATAAAWLCALGTAAVYLVGSSRSFDYDGSVTVAHFIRTPSLFAPFTRQVVFNNHVAFSFLEHLVYLATGSASETTMRLLPIACAAATVGLLVAILARTTPLLVAIAAGVLLATNPLFVETAREVRGYSLVCLCALASTSLLFSLLRQPARSRSALYVCVVALGLATHLYMIFVLATHVVILHRRHQLTPEWRQRLMAGTLLGTSAYLGVLNAMAQAASTRARTVHLSFPIDLTKALLGNVAPAMMIVAAGVIVALWLVRARPETPALAALFLVAFVALWLLVAPFDLYPRFFVWVCPAVAAAAALGLAKLRPAALVAAGVMVAAVTMGLSSANDYTTNPLITHDVASIARSAQSRGGTVCGIGTSTETLAAYIPNCAARSTTRPISADVI